MRAFPRHDAIDRIMADLQLLFTMVPDGVCSAIISLLYVDDEPALLDIGKLFLERSGGVAVTTAESALEALHMLGRKRFDAIVSDYRMPDMDGIELLQHLREQGNDIPFIIFTGKGREEVAVEALNSGADFYVQKGGDPKAQFAELQHKIRRAVAGRRAERELQRRHDELLLANEQARRRRRGDAPAGRGDRRCATGIAGVPEPVPGNI